MKNKDLIKLNLLKELPSLINRKQQVITGKQKLGENTAKEMDKDTELLAKRNKERADIFRFVQGILGIELNKLRTHFKPLRGEINPAEPYNLLIC